MLRMPKSLAIQNPKVLAGDAAPKELTGVPKARELALSGGKSVKLEIVFDPVEPKYNN
jgi:hypothetical protein